MSYSFANDCSAEYKSTEEDAWSLCSLSQAVIMAENIENKELNPKFLDEMTPNKLSGYLQIFLDSKKVNVKDANECVDKYREFLQTKLKSYVTLEAERARCGVVCCLISLGVFCCKREEYNSDLGKERLEKMLSDLNVISRVIDSYRRDNNFSTLTR